MDKKHSLDESSFSGGHPLKKMRRQTLEEFEEEFMSSGKPSATVINMRDKPVPEKEKSHLEES